MTKRDGIPVEDGWLTRQVALVHDGLPDLEPAALAAADKVTAVLVINYSLAITLQRVAKALEKANKLGKKMLDAAEKIG